MENLSYGAMAALLGLVSGGVLGLSARLGNFCTLGALEMAAFGGDQRRLRLWGIVLAVAISGTFLGVTLGQITLAETFYHQIAWNPLASIAGGLIFGYGMALAGNCGFGALVRFGGGDLRSLVVVVVMGIAIKGVRHIVMWGFDCGGLISILKKLLNFQIHISESMFKCYSSYYESLFKHKSIIS